MTAAVLQFYILFFRRLLSNGSLYFTNVLHPRSAQGLYQCVVSVNGLGTMVSRTAQLIVAGRAYYFDLPQKSCNGISNLHCSMRLKEEIFRLQTLRFFWFFRTDCTFYIASFILKTLNILYLCLLTLSWNIPTFGNSINQGITELQLRHLVSRFPRILWEADLLFIRLRCRTAINLEKLCDSLLFLKAAYVQCCQLNTFSNLRR